MLGELGCPLIQGYLTARPLAAPDFLAFWDSTVASQNEAAAAAARDEAAAVAEITANR